MSPTESDSKWTEPSAFATEQMDPRVAQESATAQMLLESLADFQDRMNHQISRTNIAQRETAIILDAWESLFQYATLPYVFLDWDMKITRYNAPFGQIFSHLTHDQSQEIDLCQLHFSAFVDPTDQDTLYRFFRRLSTSRTQRRCALKMRNAKGDMLLMMLNGSCKFITPHIFRLALMDLTALQKSGAVLPSFED